jgi:hypothetical protein
LTTQNMRFKVSFGGHHVTSVLSSATSAYSTVHSILAVS